MFMTVCVWMGERTFCGFLCICFSEVNLCVCACVFVSELDGGVEMCECCQIRVGIWDVFMWNVCWIGNVLHNEDNDDVTVSACADRFQTDNVTITVNNISINPAK